MKRRELATVAVGVVASAAGCTSFSPSDALPGSDDDDDDGSTEADTEEQSGESSSSDDGLVEGVDGMYDPEDPVEVVGAFYDALFLPDHEAANDFTHDDSPAQLFTEDGLESHHDEDFEHSDYEVEENYDDNEDAVLVTFQLEITNVDNPDVTRGGRMSIELRKQGDHWMIWQAAP